MSDNSFEFEYKRILLDILGYLINFLNSHNLRWWGAYGTLIGAVRHHGLIPWDDDIDIWMPREDYEKLISLKTEFYNGRFCVEHLSSDENFAARFVKVMDVTTSIQAKRYIPSVMGVFIDIFPLESCDESPERMLSEMTTVNAAWSDYFDYVKHYSLSDFREMGRSLSGLYRMIKTNLKESPGRKHCALSHALSLDKHITSCSFGSSKYCLSLYGYRDDRAIFKSEWFKDYKEAQYEDLIIRIPIGYHELLSSIYGDYMTPPPEEKRIPRHKPYYVNLRERLSVVEIAKRVKAGETIVY